MPEKAITERRVRLYSPLDGKVTAVLVEVGDVAVKDQVLFRVRGIDVTTPCGGRVSKVYVEENVDWVIQSSEAFPLAEMITQARKK